MKYRLVLESESMTDLAAVAQLADERGIFFDRIEKIAKGYKKHRRSSSKRTDGKVSIVEAAEGILDAFPANEPFSTSDPKLRTIATRTGIKFESMSPILTGLKRLGRLSNPNRGVWVVVDKSKVGINTKGMRG